MKGVLEAQERKRGNESRRERKTDAHFVYENWACNNACVMDLDALDSATHAHTEVVFVASMYSKCLPATPVRDERWQTMSISQTCFTSDAIARSGRILSELTLVGIEVKRGTHWMRAPCLRTPSKARRLPTPRSELHDVTERIAAAPAPP